MFNNLFVLIYNFGFLDLVSTVYVRIVEDILVDVVKDVVASGNYIGTGNNFRNPFDVCFVMDVHPVGIVTFFIVRRIEVAV